MYPKNFQKCIDHFSSLQGIGPKMAERLVLSLFKKSADTCEEFAHALEHLHDIHECSRCFNIADGDLCTICTQPNRNTTLLCIVEEPLDIIPIERAHSYDGLYHVLGGTLNGKDTTNLTIAALDKRIATEKPQELIIATNFTTEGDATALYLQRHFADTAMTLSRLARGLATGSDIEYADDLTLRSALTNRTKMV